MKNKIIITLISIIILSITYVLYNFYTSTYNYKNYLDKEIESLLTINNNIDKHISNSSNFLYYNLDSLKNEFIKMDTFFLNFSKQEIILKNKDIKKGFKELSSAFKEKDFFNYRFQKVNVTLKSSSIYLATLLSKSQKIFKEPTYLSLINEAISNIYLAKASNDSDFLINLNNNISTLRNYKFSSKEKEKFNTIIIAHLNVYNKKYKKYILYSNKLSSNIYTNKILNLKLLINKNIEQKLSYIYLFLWFYIFLLVFSIITILYLLKRIRQHQIDILVHSKNAQLGNMIENIAHQWRQPLSNISTSATGMQLRKEIMNISLEEEYSILEDINNNAQFLSKTIDTFRNYIKEVKEVKTVILQNRINITLDIISASFKDKDITLINNINKVDDIEIVLVIGELSQVIINILNNAKDIIKENNINKPWIKIDVKKRKTHAIITIEDNAGGIPLSIIDKIFDPYFTTKHKSVGTGLGLHMSKDIVENSLHGKISVKNNSQGAIFTIELPLK